VLRAIAARPPAAFRVGYVMQDAARGFPEEMPVREVLGRPAASAARWFGSVPGDDLLARSIGSLSEGERQRILLASEVLRLDGSPRAGLLLLDEPFGAVDPPAHLRLMAALLGWVRESGARNAAILVSHSPLVDLGLARSFGVPAREWTIEGGER
jgi:ABC-type Mn2+/Zn2+ transport system ATPase subunit